MQQNSFDSFLQSIGLGTLSLHGYGPLILEGTLTTLKLAGFALIVAVILGLLGASAKLSRLAPLRFIAQSYTTLIRGVPDLVLMLLIFYSLQNWLGALTDYMGWDYIDIDDYPNGLLETKTQYYFDIYSTNETGTAWAGTCQFELDSLGYNEIDSAVPFF